MQFIVWFIVVLQLLVTIVRSLFPRKDPTVIVSLSADRQRIVLTIDHGKSLLLRHDQGFVMEFELWVTELDATHCMTSLLNLESTDPRMMSNVVSISGPNQRALEIILRSRRDHAFAQRLLNRVLTALETFQSNPDVHAHTRRMWSERMRWIRQARLDSHNNH